MLSELPSHSMLWMLNRREYATVHAFDTWRPTAHHSLHPGSCLFPVTKHKYVISNDVCIITMHILIYKVSLIDNMVQDMWVYQT